MKLLKKVSCLHIFTLTTRKYKQFDLNPIALRNVKVAYNFGLSE